MIKKIGVLAGLLLLFIAVSGSAAASQLGEWDYFEDTGHYVSGEFYLFYLQNPNARTVFGSPITEEYPDPESGRKVQYFHNARFEYYPENPPGQQVKLTMVGSMLREPGQPVDFNPATLNCNQENHWDFPVCSAFLQFYQQNKGELYFGRPISNIEYLQGRLVQYFEYAQFVWMPDNPEGAKVIIAPLGLKYFKLNDNNPAVSEPIRNLEYTQGIKKIFAQAFTTQAVTRYGDTQTINVIVTDPNDASVIGASVAITIEYPNGRRDLMGEMTTNVFGVAKAVFLVNSTEMGIAKMYIQVSYNDVTTLTITSFRIWN